MTISTNPIVIVLGDVQITNQTNLKIKDTNALWQGDFQKKFSTVVSPDKQKLKDDWQKTNFSLMKSFFKKIIFLLKF